ncbi:plasmid stabilization protein [Streptomyces sp. NPDC059071]|uniref:plasmid stabilization protein n=1 Tax=unclassified Streptomyces TaxID=2593676 RepID=UPI00362A133A
MPRGSSSKRERQYEHIKESAEQRGESTKRAKEIAARTVNKERARSGEAGSSSKSSTQGKSASQRGGERSGKGGSDDRTYDELYAEAKRRDIHGRSSMNKAELKRSLSGS